MKKSKIKIFKNMLRIVIIFILGAIIGSIIVKNIPKQIDYRQNVYLELDEIGINMQWEYVSMENPPIIQNEEIYLSIDFIKENIDEYIYWDKNEDQITITNEFNVIRMKTDELEYYINDDLLELSFPIYNIDGIAYMPKSFLEDFYGLKVQYIEQTKMLNIIKENYKISNVTKKLNLRQNSDRRSGFFQEIQKGEGVYYNNSEPDQDGYIQIVTNNGYTGYIQKKYMKNEQTITIDNDYEDDYKTVSPYEPKDGKINLVFDQMQNLIANSSEGRRTYHSGVDVLVPTWFSFANPQGDIINVADKGYVEWAKDNGYQVWGLITDNFDKKVSHGVLSSSKNRRHVIKQLSAFVSIYDLDGINIDFESVPTEDGDNFIQFLRELAPLLRKQGAILSVDTFVPKPWTAHYNREEVAKIADYIIVMGYDEHYAGSDSAGSVASIGWSDIAIKDTLAENVPKEKLILGIPFYTRAWTETLKDGEIKLTSRAYGMHAGYNFIVDKGGEFVWLEDVGQYYGEVVEGNVTHKLWLEDERSLEKRLDLVLEYDIAGTGAWKRGLQKDGIWEVLENKLKNK